MKKKCKMITLILVLSFLYSNAQQKDSITQFDSLKTQNIKFNPKQLIIPATLITYGAIALGEKHLKNLNEDIKWGVIENIDEKITVDDFSQYAPMASVYVLNAFGVDGKNSLRDRTVILATSYLTMAVTVNSLKHIIKEERPDGSSFNSFPSGHTATAFMGAEFLYQEYKHKSVWYGVAGYAVATTTGLFRVYNNRHWISDVAAGAGIGILSTKIAYWTNPYITKKLFGKKDSEIQQKENKTTMLMPFYNGKQYGLGLSMAF